ncbi:phage holin family protein [Polymorphospora sp. NPDC051019]|uniref:phage holin family protein n=1 Tax=Polymorphospora sp. NPDC051019 TaxID=3155725 RepID=UPI00343EC2B5
MSDSARQGSSHTAERSEASIGELLGEVSRDFSMLLRQEAELAKAEFREEARSAGTVAAMFGGAALAGLLAVLFLSCALWWGLSNVMDQGWAALIVAVIWALIGSVLLSRARNRMKTIRPLPRTTQTAREIPDAVRGR